jgi:hypothetical protein
MICAIFVWINMVIYSPFCEQAKIIKLVGLKNGGRLTVTFFKLQPSNKI